MQYIMLIYHGTHWDVSKEEKNRVHEACGAWHDELGNESAKTRATAVPIAVRPVDGTSACISYR